MFALVLALVACGSPPPAALAPSRADEAAPATPATSTSEGTPFVGVGGTPAYGGYVSVQEYQRYDAMDAMAGWQHDDAAVRAHLDLREGMAVAEIGCGPGPWLRTFAKLVGPTGTVFEVDVDPNALAFVERRLARVARLTGKPLANVRTVQSTFTDVRLPPGSIDRAYLQEVHNYVFLPLDPDPARARARYEREQTAWTRSLHGALRPGGRLVIEEMPPSANPGAAFGQDEVARFIEGTGLFRRVPAELPVTERRYLLAFERLETPSGVSPSDPQAR